MHLDGSVLLIDEERDIGYIGAQLSAIGKSPEHFSV